MGLSFVVGMLLTLVFAFTLIGVELALEQLVGWDAGSLWALPAYALAGIYAAILGKKIAERYE